MEENKEFGPFQMFQFKQNYSATSLRELTTWNFFVFLNFSFKYLFFLHLTVNCVLTDIYDMKTQKCGQTKEETAIDI